MVRANCLALTQLSHLSRFWRNRGGGPLSELGIHGQFQRARGQSSMSWAGTLGQEISRPRLTVRWSQQKTTGDWATWTHQYPVQSIGVFLTRLNWLRSGQQPARGLVFG